MPRKPLDASKLHIRNPWSRAPLIGGEPACIRCECGKNPDGTLWVKSPSTGKVVTVKPEYFDHLGLGIKNMIADAPGSEMFTAAQLHNVLACSQMTLPPLPDRPRVLPYKHRGRRW
jgi:hypothetical protein